MSQLERVFLLSFALAGPLPAAIHAQGPETELEALQLKSTGRYREAYRKTAGALQKLLAQSELTPEQAARSEFLLALAENLTHKLPDHAAFVSLLEKLREAPAARRAPMLRARMAHYLADHLFLSGRPGQAAKCLDQLGYVTDFQVLGPLDNERGAGFRRAFAPESAPATPLDLGLRVEGKKRTVGFRRIRIDDVPLRTVDFGARMRPNRQVLAIAAFAVSTENSRHVALRLGSSGSLVVRVGGAEVLRRDCQRRPIGWDQDACVFRLQPGHNLVVIKACVQGGAFALRARLTAPDGTPLPADVKVSAEPELVTAAGKRKDAGSQNGAAGKARLRVGAVAWLEKQMEQLAGAKPAPGSEEARRLGMHAFRLGYLLALRTEDDESSRRDRKWAQVATELMPDFGAAHFLHGFTLLKRGASVADRDENARMQAYRRALRAWPRCAEAMRALAAIERTSRGNLRKAETWVQKALAINPHYVYGATERLACLDRREFAAGKAKALADFAANPKLATHPIILRNAIDLAEERNDLDEMIELQERVVAQQLDLTGITNLARLYMRKGNDDKAREKAAAAVAAFPQQRSAHALVAGLELARGDVAAATRAWNTWLEICPEDDRTWLVLADLAARAGKRDLQVSHLERALSLNPNLKERQRQLEFLAAGTEAFFAGFEIDAAAALKNDKGPDADAAAKGDSHYYVFRHELVRAYRDGTTSRYDHFLVRILNDEGVNLFDTYQPPFYSGDQTARILEAKVIRKDGSVERARLGRGFWVDLPPLQPGDAIEVAARVDDRSRSFFGDYFGHRYLFGAPEPVPVRLSRLDLVLEPGRQYHFQAVGADVPQPTITKLADGAEHRRWEMRDLERRESEERAPTQRESGPLVRVSTYGSWDEFSKWWWNLIRKQTVITPEIRAKVKELVAGAPTIDEKVQRIYDFVVTDIRYKAWEFGVHGYKPYSVAAIFARRHGDCKDKSILMNAMLSEIGVQAYPVLIRAEDSRERDDLTLPMVEHFNHCISYIPPQQGMPERFVDGTAEYHPIATLPSMDRGADVLTVKGESGDVMRIPWTLPRENRDEYRYAIRIQENGDAVVEMVHAPRLNFAPRIRDRFGNQVGKRRERLADQLGKTFGKVEILDMQFSDLKDLREPVRYSVKFKVKDFVSRDGAALRVKAAFRPERLSQLTPAERRVYDLLLTTPAGREVTVEYVAPKGYEWADPPQPVEIDSKVGSFRMTFERSGNRLTIRRWRAFKQQRIDHADYGLFKELTEAVDRAEARTLQLRAGK